MLPQDLRKLRPTTGEAGQSMNRFLLWETSYLTQNAHSDIKRLLIDLQLLMFDNHPAQYVSPLASLAIKQPTHTPHSLTPSLPHSPLPHSLTPSRASIVIAILVPEPGEDWIVCLPPSIRTRSAMPVNPRPPLRESLALAASGSKPQPLSSIVMLMFDPSRSMATRAPVACACLTMLLTHSWTTR